MEINGPYMVVGPLSTLSNWVDEFKRWLPSMNVILYHGSKDERQKLRSKHMPHGMLLTFQENVLCFARKVLCHGIVLSALLLVLLLCCFIA